MLSIRSCHTSLCMLDRQFSARHRAQPNESVSQRQSPTQAYAAVGKQTRGNTPIARWHVDVGTSANQQLHCVQLALRDCGKKWRDSVHGQRIRVSTVLEQVVDYGVVALQHCDMKQREALRHV